MNELASDLFFIIIVLVVAATLGILIGYLIGLFKKKKAVEPLEDRITDLEKELSSCRAQVSELETKADNLRKNQKKKIAELKKELSSYRDEKMELEGKVKDLMKAIEKVKAEDSETDFDSEQAKEILIKGARFTNLKIIEGIGSKIEQILKREGIDTWIKLSFANSDDIRSILISKGGSAYRVHDPESWPHQAKMASEGKWKELKDYQDKLAGGK